jgi:hypothetical protein
MENSPPGIQTMPGGVALGAGVVFGTVGPNVAGLEEFVDVDDEVGALPLAVSAVWRERDIKATIPARTSAAITAMTSHFLGSAGGGGSRGVCSLLCRLDFVAMVAAVANILEQLWDWRVGIARTYALAKYVSPVRNADETSF